jgi:hypothetical protein
MGKNFVSSCLLPPVLSEVEGLALKLHSALRLTAWHEVPLFKPLGATLAQNIPALELSDEGPPQNRIL